MQSQNENAKQEQLHWICGAAQGKVRLNLAEFYKAGLSAPNSEGNNEEHPIRSCSNDRRKSLTFERKGPYVFHLYSPLEQEPRCQALDVFFEEPVTIGEIRLQNHYVAYLSVLMKYSTRRDWDTAVRRRQLMPHPHFENGARSYFEFSPQTSWTDVTEVRFILQQPSPHWKRFYVENLGIYGERKSESVENAYLTDLIRRTSEALAMERKNERKSSTTIPLQFGTCGYEIDKLPKF